MGSLISLLRAVPILVGALHSCPAAAPGSQRSEGDSSVGEEVQAGAQRRGRPRGPLPCLGSGLVIWGSIQAPSVSGIHPGQLCPGDCLAQRPKSIVITPGVSGKETAPTSASVGAILPKLGKSQFRRVISGRSPRFREGHQEAGGVWPLEMAGQPLRRGKCGHPAGPWDLLHEALVRTRRGFICLREPWRSWPGGSDHRGPGSSPSLPERRWES